LKGVTDLKPREHLLFFDELLAGALLEGVEVDEGFMGDHACEGEADAGVPGLVIIAAVKKGIVFDREDLFEKNEAIKDGGFEARGDRDDVLSALRMARGEGQGKESAD